VEVGGDGDDHVAAGERLAPGQPGARAQQLAGQPLPQVGAVAAVVSTEPKSTAIAAAAIRPVAGSCAPPSPKAAR